MFTVLGSRAGLAFTAASTGAITSGTGLGAGLGLAVVLAAGLAVAVFLVAGIILVSSKYVWGKWWLGVFLAEASSGPLNFAPSWVLRQLYITYINLPNLLDLIYRER
jgi:hypothetical protein